MIDRWPPKSLLITSVLLFLVAAILPLGWMLGKFLFGVIHGYGVTNGMIISSRQMILLGRSLNVAELSTMLECGQRPPVPASTKKRTLQVNVRLTPEEKNLASVSSVLGFSGLSDFIRNSALEKVTGSASVLNKMLNKGAKV